MKWILYNLAYIIDAVTFRWTSYYIVPLLCNVCRNWNPINQCYHSNQSRFHQGVFCDYLFCLFFSKINFSGFFLIFIQSRASHIYEFLKKKRSFLILGDTLDLTPGKVHCSFWSHGGGRTICCLQLLLYLGLFPT